MTTATAPANSAPLIRPLAFPIQEGMLWTAGLDADGSIVADEFQAQWLRVTPYGHWYGSDDHPVGDPQYAASTVCRGCGAVGEFTFELDEQRCSRPATTEVIASALLASWPRPALHSPRGFYRQLRREALEGCAA